MTIYSLSSSLSPVKIRYVGITIGRLQKRLNEHLCESKKLKTHKDRWIQRQVINGGNIIISTLDVAKSIDELKEKEIAHIQRLKNNGIKLVNGTLGGDGAFGYRHTDEAKMKNGIVKSKKVFLFDYETKCKICEYKSISEMIRVNKFSKTSVSEVLSGKSAHHRFFTFSKTGVCPTEKPKKKIIAWNAGISTKGKQRFKTTAVELLVDGEFKKYDTVMELASTLNCSHSQICRALKYRNGEYKSHRLRYAA